MDSDSDIAKRKQEALRTLFRYPNGEKVPHFEDQDPEYGDDHEMSNRRRADFAATGIAKFAETVGVEEEEVDTILGDLIGDILHFCDGHGVDFDEVLRAGRYHYEYETDPNAWKRLTRSQIDEMGQKAKRMTREREALRKARGG